MDKKGHALRGLITDAIIELCKKEAFYAQELRIEGTICLVSDKTSVVIAQIVEQIGDEHDIGIEHGSLLPVINSDELSQQCVREKNTHNKVYKIDSCNSTADDQPVLQNKIGTCPITSVFHQDKFKSKYTCPFCVKRFRYKQLLKRHVHIHLLSKPSYSKYHVRQANIDVKCKKKVAQRPKVVQQNLSSPLNVQKRDRLCTPVKSEGMTPALVAEGKHSPHPDASASGVPASVPEVSPLVSTKEVSGIQGHVPYHLSTDDLNALGPVASISDDSLQMHLHLQQQAYTYGMMLPGISPSMSMFSMPSPNYSSHQTPRLDKIQSPPATTKSTEPQQPFNRTVDGKFRCPYCEKSYNFKHTLKDHINKHLGKRPHVCRHCGDSFTHLASLCAHIKRRHKTEMPQDFRCDLCQENFMNYQSLKQHFTWRHKGKKFPLKYTGKEELPYGLEQSRSKTSQGQSALNPESFSMSQMMSNLATQSTMLGPHDINSMTSLAPFSFQSPESMESYTTVAPVTTSSEQIFTGPASNPGKSDTLAVGNSSFSVSDFFTTVDIQTGAECYKYQCKLCNNILKERDNLSEHLNAHYSCKSHVCSLCGDSFSLPSSLLDHVQKKHLSPTPLQKDAGLKHCCVTCDKKFKFQSELERHMKHNPGHFGNTQ